MQGWECVSWLLPPNPCVGWPGGRPALQPFFGQPIPSARQGAESQFVTVGGSRSRGKRIVSQGGKWGRQGTRLPLALPW